VSHRSIHGKKGVERWRIKKKGTWTKNRTGVLFSRSGGLVKKKPVICSGERKRSDTSAKEKITLLSTPAGQISSLYMRDERKNGELLKGGIIKEGVRVLTMKAECSQEQKSDEEKSARSARRNIRVKSNDVRKENCKKFWRWVGGVEKGVVFSCVRVRTKAKQLAKTKGG